MNVKGNDLTRARTYALAALLCLCAFQGFSAEPAPAQGARRQYLVVLKKGANAPTEAEVAKLGGHVDFKTNGRLAVTLPEAAVDALRAQIRPTRGRLAGTVTAA